MMNKKKIFLSITIALALIFSMTYYLCDKYITKPNEQKNSVAIATQNNESTLDDTTKVSLFAGEKKEDELTISQLKEKLNLSPDLSQAQLSMALKEKGYVLVLTSNNELTFKRDASQGAKANKYYIGEKDGYLAIYKTDDNGTMIIENDDDVYTDNKKVENLRDGDKNKIRNFELEYDTKEEAEEDLSEFLS